MKEALDCVWQPTDDDIASSNVMALMRRFSIANYDDYYAFSIQQPDAYWREVVDYCAISWHTPFDAYVDESAGPEFPKWFPGGRLNWVQTIIDRASTPDLAHRDAVISERETGDATRISYANLSKQVKEFASGLAQQGVRRGDRIGLLMANGIEATVSLLAIAYLGAIAVPLFSGFGVDAIKSRLVSCSATVLIASAGFYRRGKWVDILASIREAQTSIPTLQTLIIEYGGPGEEVAGAFNWAGILESGIQGDQPASIMDPNDPFMIVYTSGTTGKPKGTVHTHGGFPLKIAHDSAVHFNVKDGDVFCWPADMGWIAGSLVLCSALMRGATLVCYDGAPDFPDWSRMARLIERHRVTHFGSAPTLIRGLAANGEIATEGDLSSLTLLITAGEGIDPEHFSWFQRNFGNGSCPLINYTGGTEVSGALLSSVVVKPISPAGFNTASPGVNVDIVDGQGISIEDSVGELVIRRPFVGMTQSFWQDDERYLEAYWRTIPGLWVHGDLALRKGSTRYMLGRSDDTIKLAGKRVGPAEIEEVLLELPQVNEAAAIGIDDASKGQKLVVFLVAAVDANNDFDGLTAQVLSHVELRMGKPFKPGAVHFVTQLPKTRSSKVMRRLIRNIYSGLPLGDISSLDNPGALDGIQQIAANLN
ncbi:AMP-binding protein [Pseudomonas fluorescens]|uniref:AMP-binding protein n=1 Tax=Pseudomonas fluorescens TaxID=294 RepID=UPI001913F9F3|nr:AMP-binding protein [Pseudomonas fluorescens]